MRQVVLGYIVPTTKNDLWSSLLSTLIMDWLARLIGSVLLLAHRMKKTWIHAFLNGIWANWTLTVSSIYSIYKRDVHKRRKTNCKFRFPIKFIGVETAYPIPIYYIHWINKRLWKIERLIDFKDSCFKVYFRVLSFCCHAIRPTPQKPTDSPNAFSCCNTLVPLAILVVIIMRCPDHWLTRPLGRQTKATPSFLYRLTSFVYSIVGH